MPLSLLDSSSSSGSTAFTGPLAVCAAVAAVAVYLLLVVAWWRIFAKAGRPGILSLIPVVNVFVLVKVAAGSAWKTLLLLIPVFGEIYAVILNFHLARAFGKGVGFGFGLWLLPNLFTLILAFGRARYVGA